MNIPTLYLVICTISMVGVCLSLIPTSTGLILFAAISIALVGVPHGGLDHWTGRRLLAPYLSRYWCLMFFPVYLLVAMTFALGWLVAPFLTAMSFIVASAWHFGLEDDKARETTSAAAIHTDSEQQTTSTPRQPLLSRISTQLVAIAIGGLILWVPSLFRGEELRSLLTAIVPSTDIQIALRIVGSMETLAMAMIPIALVSTAYRLALKPTDLNNWVPLATIALAATTPMLFSFTIFFCGWHSLHGLNRIKREQRLSTTRFIAAIAPLSLLAVSGIAIAGWFLNSDVVARLIADSANVVAMDQELAAIRTIFIGLSAIAIPHLLLHEVGDYFASAGFNQDAHSRHAKGALAS
jgi:Brp/Blh family beta-carotene 15,15'-monooxygenase